MLKRPLFFHLSLLAILALLSSSPFFGAPGAWAADESASPADFVANVRQQVAFLEQASRLAATNAVDGKLRTFAQSELADQQSVSKDLKSWETRQPTGGMTSPMVVAAASPADPALSNPLVTGRSAAVEGSESTGVLMASPGVLVMPQLSKLKGENFDNLYQSTQAASLKALEGLYEAYGMTGKDPALRALSLRELPRVKQQLSDLQGL